MKQVLFLENANLSIDFERFPVIFAFPWNAYKYSYIEAKNFNETVNKYVYKVFVFLNLNILTNHFQNAFWTNPQISVLTTNVYTIFKFVDTTVLHCGKAVYQRYQWSHEIFRAKIISISISMQQEWLDPIPLVYYLENLIHLMARYLHEWINSNDRYTKY